jgi:hypothetical protein
MQLKDQSHEISAVFDMFNVYEYTVSADIIDVSDPVVPDQDVMERIKISGY